MKLLVVTQKADSSDPILGFFHRWMVAFASRTEHLTVVAQYVGAAALPADAAVFSLGKEQGMSVWWQILRFWWLLCRERNNYDCVFVHMTPVWVILGWPALFLLRKRIYLWYEIRRGSWRLSLALLLARKVFSATVQGLPRPHRKQVVTGHGIDAEVFSLPLTPNPSPGGRGENREPGLIVSVGRITRSKRYDVILRAFATLPQMSRLVIAGGVVTQADEGEWERVQTLMMQLGVIGRVTVHWVDPAEMPGFLRRADLMLHACVGGLDKAVLEAMASGCPVVSSSSVAQEVLPESCRATDETMGNIAEKLLSLPPSERAALSEELRKRVMENHSLAKLIARLVKEME
ncbi:MAG: glycosyltransferase family 4 protein [Candidatus Peribacteraceae bacterium]|jgi:glycosyltransferase involved in cell wall biosynthesis|nr:glycosyltransferase family 4 protein [Candidatus Peribacteraceae bacterium]